MNNNFWTFFFAGINLHLWALSGYFESTDSQKIDKTWDIPKISTREEAYL